MRVLIVVDPVRKDFFEYLVDDSPDYFEWSLIWDYKYQGTTPSSNRLFTKKHKEIKLYYWSDFTTARAILLKTAPKKIVFLEILDLWQIPLIVASKKKGITTFFLEHGVGNSVEIVLNRFGEDMNWKTKLKFYGLKLLHSSRRALKNRVYYYSQLFDVRSLHSTWKYFILPMRIKLHTPVEALSKLKFEERTPAFALLFNKNNIAPFLIYNTIKEDRIITEGVPLFDKYYNSQIVTENYYFVIEHPYLEEQILNWTDEFHEKIARSIELFAKQNNIRVYIKLHPRSRMQNWLRYSLDESYITILQSEDPTQLMLKAKLILGYSSSLINAMICCKKNVVLLGWHPEPLIFGDDFSQTGLCHKSMDVKDLFVKRELWESNNLCFTNKPSLNAFFEEYNYPFDGKATKRILDSITTL